MRRTTLLPAAMMAALLWLLAGCAGDEQQQTGGQQGEGQKQDGMTMAQDSANQQQTRQEEWSCSDMPTQSTENTTPYETPSSTMVFQTSSGPRSAPAQSEEIWIMNANGSDLRRLTDRVSPDFVGWSICPNGAKIAFATENIVVRCGNSRGDCSQETTARIYVRNVVGSNETKLLEDERGVGPPDWSPDGQKLVFGLSDADARRCDIYTMKADGRGDHIPLTSFDGCEHIEALEWSPDGKKIAVEILEEGNGYDNDIYVVDVPAEGNISQPQQLTNGPHTWWNADPTWSPDSTEIAYTHVNTAIFEHQWSIYKMKADGSGKTRIAAGQIYEEPPNNPPPGQIAMASPAWSPSGEKIAFVREYPEESPNTSSAIYAKDSDGYGEAALIRRFNSETVSDLEWHPPM